MQYSGRDDLVEQRRKKAIYEKKLKKRRMKRIRSILILILLIVLVVVCLVCCKGSEYDDQESFEKYSKKVFKSIKTEKEIGETDQEIKFGDVKSTAIEKPVEINDTIDNAVSTNIEALKKKFEMNYADYDNPDTDKYALFVTYDSSKPKDELTNVVFYYLIQKEEDKKMVDVEQKAYSFNYYDKIGSKLLPIQVFNADYRTKLATKMDEYLNKKYGDDLKEGYKNYISDKETNYTNFSLKDDSVIFYFNADTILPMKKGIVKVEFSNDELEEEGIKREKINLRAIDPAKPMVAITFDDGPATGTSNRILDCLEDNGAVATFFELGENVENVSESKEILLRQQDIGCETGSHSYSHANLNTCTAAQIRNEVDKTNAAIKKLTGAEPTVFRPPYGNLTDARAKIVNMPCILWSVDTLDWKSRNASSVIDVVKGTNNLDGKVILMHSIYDSSAQALEVLVPWLKKNGYQMVTVSELLTYSYNETPKKGKFYGYGYFYKE